MKAFYKQEADNRLSGLDTNKDGKVSWEEYAKGAENRGGNQSHHACRAVFARALLNMFSLEN